MVVKESLYALVALLNRDVTLWYVVPENFENRIDKNTLVYVPLLRRKVLGIVVEVSTSPSFAISKIKPIISVEKIPEDRNYFNFLEHISWYYQINKKALLSKLQNFLRSKEALESVERIAYKQVTIPHVTTEQQIIIDAITPDIVHQRYSVSVIYGVTGSGKTECYKALIKEAIQRKKTVLFLLPEVSLAVAFEGRLSAEIPDITIIGFHSGKTKKEKREVLNALILKKPIVIVGVHLPIMLPIENIGLIIIDEEHDSGYQEKNYPKMNMKEVALFRARIYNIPIVLGSATPSVHTLYTYSTRST